jgi:hypothetical protein
MARSFFTSAGAYLRSKTGSPAPEKIEAAKIVDAAMAATNAPTSKVEAEANAEAVKAMRADGGLLLIKSFPLYGYLQSLASDVTPFPAAQTISDLADVNDERIGSGLEPKSLPWNDELWAAEATEVYGAYLRATTAARRHGNKAAKALHTQADSLYERTLKKVQALCDARLLAAYNAAADWCDQLISGKENDERKAEELKGVVEAEEAARKAADAVRGRVAPMDRIEAQVAELRKTMADQAKTGNERMDRLEAKFSEALDAFIQFTQVRQSAKAKPSA